MSPHHSLDCNRHAVAAPQSDFHSKIRSASNAPTDPYTGTSRWGFRRPIQLLSAFCLIAFLSGCPTKPQSDATGNSSDQTSATDAPAQLKPLLPDWKEPQAALVFTGDIHGYMEPCGCTGGQSGGFAMRGDLLRQLREEKNWPTTAFDVGGVLYDLRLSYPQSKIKFHNVMKGLNLLGYQGMALGKEDLLLGGEEIYTQSMNLLPVANFDVPFISNNTTIFGTKDLGTPIETRVVEIGGLKIGVTAISGKSSISALQDSGIARDSGILEVVDPSTTLPAAIEKLKAENADVLVLLSAATIEESRELAAAFPEFQIVVTAHSEENPSEDSTLVGDTLMVKVGRRGKSATVVGIHHDKTFQAKVVELSTDTFVDNPAMIELMRMYQEDLKNNWSTLAAQQIPDPSAGTFVGVESCKDCHTYAYNVWKQSKHSHAYESLIKGRPGKEETWVSRIHDPECLACHVVGWDAQRALRHASGFVDLETTPHLADQQCENCHGPGSNHVELEKAWKPGAPLTEELLNGRKQIRLTLTEAKTNTCVKCHDADNSPNFDFDKYWQKINHTGRRD